MRSDGPTPVVDTAVLGRLLWGWHGMGLAAWKHVEARRAMAGTLGTETAQCPPCVGREGGRLRKICSGELRANT